jgi:hypothetical protein
MAAGRIIELNQAKSAVKYFLANYVTSTDARKFLLFRCSLTYSRFMQSAASISLAKPSDDAALNLYLGR